MQNNIRSKRNNRRKLARINVKNYTDQIKLVGRNPQKCIQTIFFKANLLDPESVVEALENTEIAYLTVGLLTILKYGLEIVIVIIMSLSLVKEPL
jgi:hypothetical protein